MRLGMIMTRDDGTDYVHWIFEAAEIPQYAPPCDRIHEVGEDVMEGWLWNDGDPIPDPTPPPPPPPPYAPTVAELKELKLAEIAAARFEAETGGIEIQGTRIATDRESQALITGAALQAYIDPSYVCQWKTAGGFVTLDAAALLGIAQAVRQHVQNCFDREAELAAQVEAATTAEEVEAIAWA